MKDLSKMTVAEMQAEIVRAKSGQQEAEDIAREMKLLIENLNRELQRRLKPSPQPRVSDHALFRYLERVYNLDLEAVRNEILSDRAKDALKMGATGYTHNGVKFKAKDGVLVTVIN